MRQRAIGANSVNIRTLLLLHAMIVKKVNVNVSHFEFCLLIRDKND